MLKALSKMIGADRRVVLGASPWFQTVTGFLCTKLRLASFAVVIFFGGLSIANAQEPPKFAAQEVDYCRVIVVLAMPENARISCDPDFLVKIHSTKEHLRWEISNGPENNWSIFAGRLEKENGASDAWKDFKSAILACTKTADCAARLSDSPLGELGFQNDPEPPVWHTKLSHYWQFGPGEYDVDMSALGGSIDFRLVDLGPSLIGFWPTYFTIKGTMRFNFASFTRRKED